jgi:DNA-binding XRE family transcriptional regulator
MKTSDNLNVEFVARLLGKAQELSEIRKVTNLSQVDMAQKCGVSTRTIVRFETLQQPNPYLVFCYKTLLT